MSRLSRMAVLGLLLWLSGLAAPAPAAEDPDADRYFRGNALYNRKMYDLAVEEYKLFLGNHPEHPKAGNARHGLALSYYAAGHYAAAESLLQEVIGNGRVGNKEQLTLLRAQCLLHLDRAAEAEKQFASLLASGTDAIVDSAMAGMLDAQWRQGQWATCIATADKLLARNPTPVIRKRALYQAAHACHQSGRLAQALPYLEKLQPLVKDDPMAPQVALLLAETYRATGQLDKAAEHYASTVDGFDGDVAADAHYRRGVVQFAAGRYDEAIAAFQASLELRKPENQVRETKLYLGRAWLEKGDYGKAIEILAPMARTTSSGSPADPAIFATDQRFARARVENRAALWLGRAYLRQEKYAEAETFLGDALNGLVSRFGSRNSLVTPDILFDRANALVALERFAEAASLFELITRQPKRVNESDFRLWPQANDAMRLRAISLHRVKDYAKSLEAADEFLSRFKDDPLVPEVLFLKAENFYLLNRLAEAEEVYAAFLAAYAQDANAAAATLRLGEIYHRQGRKEEAAAVLAQLAGWQQSEGEVHGQANFIAGDSHFRLGQWEQAVTRLTAFVESRNLPPKRAPGTPPPAEPNIDSALLELALSHVKLGNRQAAVTRLQQLIDLFDDGDQRAAAMVELGRLQYEAGDLDAATQILSGFVERFGTHPQRPSAEYYLGWVALKKGRTEQAEGHFAMVARNYAKDPLAADAALQMGLVQMSMDKFAEARDTFARLARAYPQHPRMDLILFSSGLANARMKRWQEAIGPFRKVVETFPQSEHADDAVYEWAWCEKGMKRNPEAVERYQYLIDTYPDSELRQRAETEMAELTYGSGQYDQAIAQLTGLLAGPADAAAKEQALFRLGTAYYSKGDFEESAKTFETFARQHPDSGLLAAALFQAGESRMKVRETALASKHFQAASTITGLDPSLKESALLRLGESHGLTRRWRESSDAYEQLLREFPESKWARNAHFGMAWALEKQGRFAQAIDAYRAVIDAERKDELSARCQFQIGECYFAMKQYDEAIRELAPVHTDYKHKDWAAKALLETGRVLDAKGDQAGAMETFRDVIRRFPDETAAIVAKGRLDEMRLRQ